MIKRKIAISALVLLLSINIMSLASCGGNKDTTHDAGGDGQVVTENKNESTDKKNENGVIGEVITDVKDGVGDIVDDVTGNGNGMNDNGTDSGMNGSDVNGDSNMNGNGMNGNGTENGGTKTDSGEVPARMRPIPRGK